MLNSVYYDFNTHKFLTKNIPWFTFKGFWTLHQVNSSVSVHVRSEARIPLFTSAFPVLRIVIGTRGKFHKGVLTSPY